MGYRWVRLGLRMNAWGTLFRISGFRVRKIRKNRKTGKIHMAYQIKAVGKLVNVVALKIQISGFQIRKNRTTGKLHMTYQIKALGKLVNVVKLEIRISGFWLGAIHLVCTQTGGEGFFDHSVHSKGLFTVTMTSYCVPGGGEGVKNAQKVRTY